MQTTDLGQLRIGPVRIVGPIKARISGNLIPSFTIDLTAPPEKGILHLIRPRITLLIGGEAYEIEWGDLRLKPADPAIFERDTLLDTINKMGIFPIIAVTAIIGFGIYMLLKPKEEKAKLE